MGKDIFNLKKMKLLFLLSIACILSLSLAANNCSADNKCQGCLVSVCTECYNDLTTGTGARTLTTGTGTVDCKQKLAAPRLITDCKYAGPTIPTKTSASWDVELTDCMICNKAWKNWDTVASPKALTCSDTPLDSSCSAITNCERNLCRKTGSSTFTASCQLCKAGYLGATMSDVSVPAYGTTDCPQATAHITNCKQEKRITATNGGIQCEACNANFAVDSLLANACTSFTTDEFCRMLISGNCYACHYGYYFSGSKCKLAAKTLIVGAILSLLNFLF